MSASPSKPGLADAGPRPPRNDELVREVPLAGGGTRRERFDLLERLILQEDPDGGWLRFSYTPDGRPRRVEHSSGEWVEYDYDPCQRTVRARTARTETILWLTEDGAPRTLVSRVDGREWRVGYRRDEWGRVAALCYPGSDEWTRFERTADGGLTVSQGDRRYLQVEPRADRSGLTIELESGVRIEEELLAGPPPRLARVAAHGASGGREAEVVLEYDAAGRLSRAGEQRFDYDAAGRLATSQSDQTSHAYVYDEQGRLVEHRVEAGRRRFRYGDGPRVAGLEQTDGSAVAFEYDPLGRRVARRSAEGETRYAYNLFGQLRRVDLADGGRVEYLYDGFGRLVGRQADGETTYYVVGLDGERLAEADATGEVRWSYLWLGLQCLGRVAGPIGGPLEQSYHRLPGGRMAIGDGAGRLECPPLGEPFGADAPLENSAPGYGGLFGDPLTGLLLASTRWLDPNVAQFVSPDSWFGVDPGRDLEPRLQVLLAALPGGTGRQLDPLSAYAWCAYDPVNFLDLNGHNWLGLIFSFISAFLWESQLTGIALEMEAFNILLEPITLLVQAVRGDLDTWWRWSVFNIPPPVASYRLMVPFAFILNGLLKFREDRAWTLGNVIWERRSDLVALEEKSKRELLICDNADTYVASAEAVAAGQWRARSPLARATGTVASVGAAPAGGAQIDAVTMTVPAPPASPGDIFDNGDRVSIRVTGTATDELRTITNVNVAAATVTLTGPPLPAAFDGQNVELVRVDRVVVRIEGGGNITARTIQLVRGTALHFGRQVSSDFPGSGLEAKEYLPASIQSATTARFPVEQSVIRLAEEADLAAYAANNFVRILAVPAGGGAGAAAHTARTVALTRAPTDVVLDRPLPTATYASVEIARLDASGAPALNQTVPNDAAGNPIPNRVGVAGLPDLRARDGLEILNSAAPPATERRIVTQLFLSCAVAALPADLHNTPLTLDRLEADPAQATGRMQGNDGRQIKLDAGQTLTLPPDQPVHAARVQRQNAAIEAFGVIESFDPDPAILTVRLLEGLPPADFGNDEPVRINLMTPVRNLALENVPAPGDLLIVLVDDPVVLAQNNFVLVRSTSQPPPATFAAVRQLSTAPAQQAGLDADLPNTHFAGLSVQRFVEDSTSVRSNATAPEVRQRLTIVGANPYVVNDELFIADQGGIPDREETWGRVDAVLGGDVILDRPIEQPFAVPPDVVDVVRIAPSGITTPAVAGGTPAARLDEGLVLIPSDPDHDLLTRREALENHEMRHVGQGAVWGPFLLSLPIPWLAHVGLSFTRFSQSSENASKWTRHLGGITDTLLAGLIWGAGKVLGKVGPTETIRGEVNDAARQVVAVNPQVDEARIKRYSNGSYVTAIQARDGKSGEAFNIVDELNTGQRQIKLRFPLEEDLFATGDPIDLYVAPFEQIRKFINTALNLERLWSDHIPVGWGRALSRFLNRDSWLPFLGWYFLGLYRLDDQDKDQYRLTNEADAAFHSGDLYSDLVASYPREIFVGQFSKLFAFINTRGEGIIPSGLGALGGPVGILRVRLPTGVTAADVAGSIPAGATAVTFRESHFIQLADRVSNAVGVFFAASQPGDYQVRPPDPRLYDDGLIFSGGLDEDFFDLATVTVRALEVTPDPAAPLFETESVVFDIEGDSSATYELRFPPGVPGPLGAVSGRRFSAPVLAAGTTTATQDVQITATYLSDHPVFRGPGQLDQTRLAAEQLTNLCQVMTLTINAIADPVIVDPAIGAVTAGTQTDFTVDIAPVSANVTSPLPGGAMINGRVIVRQGRPATLTFVAPNAVTGPSDVTIRFEFGTDAANRKVVDVTVRVNPA